MTSGAEEWLYTPAVTTDEEPARGRLRDLNGCLAPVYDEPTQTAVAFRH